MPLPATSVAAIRSEYAEGGVSVVASVFNECNIGGFVTLGYILSLFY
jgi:hypothetical protein